MNVEEGMELLRDPKVWNVSLTPRPGVFAKSRPTLWQFASVGFAALAAVAIVTTSAVLLGSLQPAPPPAGPVTSHTPEPSHTQTPEPSLTPTPSKTPEPPQTPTIPSTERTGLSAPGLIFDGDCERFISNNEMNTIANTTVEPYVDGPDVGLIRESELAVYKQQGVIVCEWQSSEGHITMIVMREGVAPSTKHDTCGPYNGGEGGTNDNLCVFDAVANGLRMTGLVVWPTRADSKGIGKRLVTHFENTNSGSEVTPAPAASVGSWPRQLSCDLLSPLEVGSKSVDLAVRILGTDAGSLPFEDEIRDDYAAPGCLGHVSGEDFLITAVGDGAWQFDTALDKLDAASREYSATSLTGLDNAVVTTDGDGTTYYVVSGPNFLTITLFGDTDAQALIDAVLAKLA